MKKFISYIVSHLRIVYLISIMAVTVALILIMFPNDYGRVKYDYTIGSFWRGDDLYAPYDFTILKPESESNAELERIKNESTRYFHYDNDARGTTLSRLAASDIHGQRLTLARQVVSLIYNSDGYYNVCDDKGMEIEGHPVVVLEGNVGKELDSRNLMSPKNVEAFLIQAMADSSEATQLSRILVDSILAPSLVFDANRTHLELDTRLSQASFTSRMVQQNELIVSKGQRIDDEIALALKSLEDAESNKMMATFDVTTHYIGQALLCIIAFVALYIFLKNIKHPMLEDIKKVSFAFFIVIFISAIVALLVRKNPELVLLAPVCIVPILMHVFFDMRVALYIHIVAVIIIGNMVPNSYEFIFYQLVSGMMSIITVRNFEKRSSFFAVALVIFSTYSLIYVAGVLSTETTLASLQPERFLIFFINAILTLLSYPLIFLFERMFGMTTNLTLLEISSTNTPALRELSQKAPGTFQHSIQVANISEDIINEIGGNAMLTKCGALYHDIGKINAPLYFTENQNNGFNPHDNLGYHESAQIITKHVRDGIDLAKKYKLPTDITDFIRTHHGTTVTGYFYAQAKLNNPDGDININDFRYLGPTPFSRETAVVMLVDSVEAACKSLKNHDKESLDRMVDKIIDDKMAMNQLNNCPLTLQDIDRIRTRLKESMMSIYHVRIAYPMKNN
ncbi:MAG: HDIG domain-containing protein [Bacteroidales bacterium]|nr:HDIG domain-containing protein [Bacteroidales bacterium]